MTNVYTLDTLRSDLDNKFAPVEIDLGSGSPIVLRNLMRMGTNDRKTVMDSIAVIQADRDDDADPNDYLEAVKTVLRLVADAGRGDALADAIGDDLALAMKLVELWIEATQPGEAENSPA